MFIASVTSVYRLSGSSDVTGASLTSCHDKTKPSPGGGKIIDRNQPGRPTGIPIPRWTMYLHSYLRSASQLFLTKTKSASKSTAKPPSDVFFNAVCQVCRVPWPLNQRYPISLGPLFPRNNSQVFRLRINNTFHYAEVDSNLFYLFPIIFAQFLR